MEEDNIPTRPVVQNSNKNIFKVLLLPHNRVTLVAIVVCLVIFGGGIYSFFSTGNDTDFGETKSTSSVGKGSNAVATGKESAAYMREVEKYNKGGGLDIAREENISAHPIMIKDDPSAYKVCSNEFRKYEECMINTGLLQVGACSINDTECMRRNNLIKPDECAPADLECLSAGGKIGGFSQSACSESDTQCMREAGIIGVGECAPKDAVCKDLLSKVNSNGLLACGCQKGDVACLAKAVGCAMDDTLCMRNAGIIGSRECAPEDDECRAAMPANCEIDDTACMIRNGILKPGQCAKADKECQAARAAGCEIDDTACLIRNGILKPGQCAKADSKCLVSLRSTLLDAGAKFGCAPDDTRCYREHGLIGNDECAPEDDECRAAMAAGCEIDDTACMIRHGILKPGQCAKADDECRAARAAGCEIDDTACLIRNGILKPGQCAKADKECQAARAAGCEIDDTACLIRNGILKPGQCAKADKKCQAGLRGTLAEAGAKFGCNPEDTLCYRENGLIGNDECAPDDKVCSRRTVVLPKVDDKNPRRLSEANPARMVRGQIEGDQLNDEAYMQELLRLVGELKDDSSREPQGLSITAVGSHAGDDDEKLSLLAQQAANSNDAEQASAVVVDGGASCLVPMKNSGDMLYAISEIALNSDYAGPASLEVVSGAYSGSRMIGTMEFLEDKVRLLLSNWVQADGTEIPVEAIALDPETTLAAVSSKVNHHVLYRYGWWGLGKLAEGLSKAAELDAQSALIVSGTDTVASDATVDSSAEVKIAVGELGSALSEVWKERLNRPATVYVAPGKPMGVFFMNKVCDPRSNIDG